MNDNVQLFNHDQFGILRIVERAGEAWFIARDVCEGLDTDRTAIRRLDEDERDVYSMHTPGGEQKLAIISFPGMLSLILGSRKPEAREYKRWVTHVVLPSIHRRGVYATPETAEHLMNDPDFMIATFTALKEERERRAELEAENAELAPKALFADSVANAHNLILVRDMAHVLRQNGVDVGQNRLFEWLREDGYIEKRRNEPTQRSLELGIMRVVEHAHTRPDGSTFVTRTPKITGKGQTYFANRYCNHDEVA